MITLREIWGMALMVLIVVVWLPSILTVPPIEALRSPGFDEGIQTTRIPSAPSLLSKVPAETVRSPNFDEPTRIAVNQLSKKEGGRDRLVPIEKLIEQVSRYEGDGVAEKSDKVVDLPAIRECPAFLNGKKCVTSRKTRELDGVCDVTAVHIAMTLDAEYLRGSMAAIFSILKHAECPENVIFHFIVSGRDVELGSLCQRTFPYLRFKLYHFDRNLVKDLISPSYRTALEEPLNYARNYLADMLENCVERVIYLDSDLVVVDDIATLWNTNLGPHAIGAPEYCQANLTRYFTPAFWDNSSLTSTFEDREPCYFNTGVMVMDLAKWRQEDYTKSIEMWMRTQRESRIYALGSLPPFLLVFAGSVQPIDHRWNQHGLGGDIEGECRTLYPGPVSLLHWSGKWKPWIRLDNRSPCPLDKLWLPYDLLFQPRMHS